MAALRAALALLAAIAVALLAVSGGSRAAPRTLPGMPAPFLGDAVVGAGGVTAAIDAYGDVVGLWAPGPTGRGLIDDPLGAEPAAAAPAAGAIVPRVSVSGGPPLYLWQARSIQQSYLARSEVLESVALFAAARVTITYAVRGGELQCVVRVSRGLSARRLGCEHRGGRVAIRRAAAADRRWLRRGRALGPRAPGWARRMYVRSLLVLRALTDRRSGAVAAGPRDGWNYVWPRDASTVAIALASAGHRQLAQRVVQYLLRLQLQSAARFSGEGAPVPGRGAEGDAAGWVDAAARAAGLRAPGRRAPWRERADYQERSGQSGDFLANAIAAGVRAARIQALFANSVGLERSAGDPGSGLDSAAAWAVRPFPDPALFPAVRETLRRLLAAQGRFGILPGEDWPDGEPWTAPTAWSAWSLAALGERHAALRLLADLRRDATPAGLLPERVGARAGIPRSTTPLAWSHAFAILALRQLWPGHRRG